MPVTNGTVRYEDGVKAAEDYAPAKKAVVELSFEVPEGGDPTKEADAAQAEAVARVHEMLGLKAEKRTRTTKPKGSAAELQATAEPPSAPVAPSAPEVKEIGNDDLLSAVTRKNAELNDAPRILKLMTTFIPEGMQNKVQNIPQDRRQAFLDALAKETK